MYVINKAVSLANARILRVGFLVNGKLAAIFVRMDYKIGGVYLENRILII